MKAIFFDRDGVINDNSQHYYTHKIEQWTFNPGIIELMSGLLNKGYKLFIVTNQGGVARGKYSKSDIVQLHLQVCNALKEKGIIITDIAVCPHHPLIENCLCRKPQPLMLEKLIARYHIDKAQSYMIGDSKSDGEAATQAGIKSIIVPKNKDVRQQINHIL
ncbi:MAG: HAD family hydrolase [Salinivirgaceae bacterium]|nr:HAD family hydrolase [Salinivirgaceae bacterium]MDD4747521.1 HAD family hydrolase [Salinivirgaceae bacterium]MDY0280550.1 HAD family hydrolase [Salinivirgaceae bacterium]